ncbi:potassium channel family protein [Salinisphaera hydrothermalis]|uniref:Potassium channel domain-containing protein n=1 Tax=Salinisphaera hydrothermalis (strain C41B8) TaxID=1304275 RepID=A0A084IRQ2_SALHC|nr:potassium channel family protein [Salinisphaera hydrothermalis]KEZ79386.1 hypothetical protein C41B8_01515 [Salinisphaera hydrothermalis C41B8]
MSNPLFWVGAALLLVLAYDATRTTLSASSSGPVTNTLTSGLWRILLGVHRLRGNHALLAGGGPALTLVLIVTWVLLAWSGWLLVFCSAPDAVTHSTTGLPADTVNRAYFVGYTLTTLGYGDMVPGGGVWKILATVAGANGLLLFTLAITYALPIVSAATEKRQLALCIHAMGASPEEILEFGIGNGDFDSLSGHLDGFESMIAGASQKHLAYPILHYFHSASSVTALPLALVRLDLALELARLRDEPLPPSVAARIRSTQHVIQQFLATLRGAFIRPIDTGPEIPSLKHGARLLDADPDDLACRIDRLEKLNLLAAYIEDDGRAWSHVWHPTASSRTQPEQDY